MVSASTTTHVSLEGSPSQLWPAFKDSINIICKRFPDVIQSCELLQGDGGVGSIRLVKFGPASGLVTFAKEEITEMDDDNMRLTYNLLEGDLKKKFKIFKPSISLAPAGTEETQSIATWKLEYEVYEGEEPQLEMVNEGARFFFKMLETSLKAESNKL